MEFLNNRQKVISAVLQNLKVPSIPKITPAYLADSKVASGIERSLRRIKEQVASIRTKLERVLKDPSANDPVFKTIKKVVCKETRLNLKFVRSEKPNIEALALHRYQRGFPPRKKQDHSIGDAINWEWILKCAASENKDVLIVSRDGDFGLRLDNSCYLNDWLEQEFKEKVSPKRKAELMPSLAQALKKLGIPVTPDEEKEERIIIQQNVAPPPCISGVGATGNFSKSWPELLNRAQQKSSFLSAFLVGASTASYEGNKLTIGFDESHADYADLIDNTKNHMMLKAILKEMGKGEDNLIRFVKLQSADFSAQDSENSPPNNGELEDDVPF